MSDSRVYEFHQKEIADLKTAAAYAQVVCTDLKRLLEGIRDNQPNWAHWAIKEFLDHNNQLESRLNPVEHLIVPVGVPVMVPRYKECRRRNDGTYADLPSLTCSEMREYAVAHRAAWAVHRILRDYLWDVWRRGHPGLLACNDVTGAADELVESRWQEIRDELEAMVDYDCDGLRQAVEAESKAAMVRCRQSIVGDAATTLKPDIDAVDDAPKPSRDRIEVNVSESRVRLDDTWYDVQPDAAVLFDACVNSHPKPVFASHLDGDIRPKRIKESLPRQLKAIFHSVKGQGCWLEI